MFLILIIFSAFYIESGYAGDSIPIFVSIPPQKQFVQQIGKDKVHVQVMVEPGADPHTYEPKPQQMVAISKARLYFAIGIDFETAKLKKIRSSSPDLKVVPTDRGIRKIPMAVHHHDPEESHHAEGLPDPHIWLSPRLVMVQARTILKALQDIDPENSLFYENNCAAFMSELTRLDQDLTDLFSGKSGLRFMVFHPSWGYFAHTYGLQQIPIEMEGKAPKPSQLKELIDLARKNRIRVIFAQPQISSENAKLIAREIGGEVFFVDPLAENWFENLRLVASRFKAALRP
ncbi:MAG: cation ABC transporter substrate-binding protein [Desulfobacteraceae bacterium]|nr:MAG: cation ABC transporter substrate-binding protein [Desulfobacteraceae bacterium]